MPLEAPVMTATWLAKDIPHLAPPRPAAGSKFDDRAGADGQIGREAVAIRRLKPLALLISISNQLTLSALVPSRSALLCSQR